MPEIDESYRLIADISDEKIPLPEELFELDESIEIVSMKSDNSGIFDPEIDQLIIEDSSVIEIEINDGHDEMELNEENDSNETEDDSSFRIGDLEL